MKTPILRIALLVLELSATSQPCAMEINQSDKTILVESTAYPDRAIDASFIEGDGQGRWFVGGVLNGPRAAWAAQVDIHGHKTWEYIKELLPEVRAEFPAALAIHPAFTGGAVAANGMHFLCGFMPRGRGKGLAAFVDVLDANGKLIREQTYYANVTNGGQSPVLYKCVIFGDLLIGIGNKTIGLLGSEQNWVIAIGLDGRVRWDRTFPRVGADPSAALQGISVRRRSRSLIVAITDNFHTDVFSLSEDGSVISSRSFGGRYLIAQQASEEPLTQLYGAAVDGMARTTELIAINDQLGEVYAWKGPVQNKFTATAVYRLQDGTLVAFGSIRRSSGYEAGVAIIGAELKSQEVVPIDGNAREIGGEVSAVDAFPDYRGYVVVTPYIHLGRRGAAIRIVSIS